MIRRTAWSPGQKTAIQFRVPAIELAIHAGRSHFINLTIRDVQCLRAIESDVAMVNQLWISRVDFNASHVTRSRDGYGQNKTRPRVCVRAREQNVGRQFYYEIRLTQLPPFGECRGSWQVSGSAFRCSFGNPLLDRLNLFVSQPALADKFSVARFRQPWRHIARTGDGRNLPRMSFNILIIEEAEGA